jgi:alcohol dehydrogenase, propanol-preferring
MRAMIFEQVGEPLREVRWNGRMRGYPHERHPHVPYDLLREERIVRSVANLTRRDGEELLALVPRAGVKTQVSVYPLAAANQALADLRAGRFTGAAVLVP